MSSTEAASGNDPFLTHAGVSPKPSPAATPAAGDPFATHASAPANAAHRPPPASQPFHVTRPHQIQADDLFQTSKPSKATGQPDPFATSKPTATQNQGAAPQATIMPQGGTRPQATPSGGGAAGDLLANAGTGTPQNNQEKPEEKKPETGGHLYDRMECRWRQTPQLWMDMLK